LELPLIRQKSKIFATFPLGGRFGRQIAACGTGDPSPTGRTVREAGPYIPFVGNAFMHSLGRETRPLRNVRIRTVGDAGPYSSGRTADDQ